MDTVEVCLNGCALDILYMVEKERSNAQLQALRGTAKILDFALRGAVYQDVIGRDFVAARRRAEALQGIELILKSESLGVEQAEKFIKEAEASLK